MKESRTFVALAGQLNCGKSTLFNALTGASQHVANYPDVTVEKMSGRYSHNGKRYEVVDLPGTYSLTSYSPEERVTRDYLLNERPSIVINVVDASNLKRNLYLTFQLIEMDVPVVIVLNMMDVAERRKIKIKTGELEHQLGVKIIPASMKKRRGKEKLLDIINKSSGKKSAFDINPVDYDDLEPYLRKIEAQVKQVPQLTSRCPARWLAVKLMENDSQVIGLVREKHPSSEGFLLYIKEQRAKFEKEQKELPERLIAFQRYKVADRIVRIVNAVKSENNKPLSDKVDSIVCHRFLGPVILVGIIYLLYSIRAYRHT